MTDTPISPNHQKLFRHCIFMHQHVETGAPLLYPYAPFGGSEKRFLNVVADILEMPRPKTSDDAQKLATIYAQFLLSLDDIIDACHLPVGTYQTVNFDKAMHFVGQRFSKGDEKGGMAKLEEYLTKRGQIGEILEDITVTEDHLKMIPNAEKSVVYTDANSGQLIRFDTVEKIVILIMQIDEHSTQNVDSRFDMPALEFEPKRPYGSTNLVKDLYDLEIFHEPPAEDPETWEAQFERALEPQWQLAMVVQAKVMHGIFANAKGGQAS